MPARFSFALFVFFYLSEPTFQFGSSFVVNPDSLIENLRKPLGQGGLEETQSEDWREVFHCWQ